MAVALIDNGFRAHVSVAGDSRNESSFSWSTNPGAPAAGVFVAVFSGSITNQATGVTYGGQAMDLVAEAHVSGAEDTGTVALYFLGSDIPTGNQTIVVSRINNSTRMGAIGAAVSADADTEIYADGIALLEGNGSVSEQNADDGLQSGDPDSLRFAAGWFGHGSAPPAGPNSEESLSSYQWTSSNQSARVVVEATGGNGPRPVGFSTATADERAIVHFAIREAQGADPQDLDGTILAVTPTFGGGDITSTIEVAGQLLSAPTSFPGGAIDQALTLHGTLLEASPTFPGGTVDRGPVTLTGSALGVSPVFPGGAVSPGAVILSGTPLAAGVGFPGGRVRPVVIHPDGPATVTVDPIPPAEVALDILVGTAEYA